MITDKAIIVERARNLARLRVPFVHQGTTLEGIDCVGGLAWILKYDKDDIPSYPRDPVGGELERELTTRLGEPIMEFTRVNRMTSTAGLQSCDIVSIQYAGPIRHVGIIVPHVTIAGAWSMVHTDSDVGFTTECIFDEYWQRRVMKVWRL